MSIDKNMFIIYALEQSRNPPKFAKGEHMKNFVSLFDTALKERIDAHFEKHEIVDMAIAPVGLICLACRLDIKGKAFLCKDANSPTGIIQHFHCCNKIEHDLYIKSGRPFECVVAIEIAEKLGMEAGIVEFSKWLFANIKGNSGIDVSPFIRLETSEVKLENLPPYFYGREEKYIEIKFHESRKEMWDKLYKSIISYKS